MFYCKSGNSSIFSRRVCDGVFDCLNMEDECQNCIRSQISSDGYIIGNDFLKIHIAIEVILIITFNSTAIAEHLSCQQGGTSKTKRLDRTLCLCLCSYNLLMAAYLGIISIANIVYRNQLCQNDTSWRSSVWCNVSGLFFQLGSLGSLQIAVLKAITTSYVINAKLGAELKVRAIRVGLIGIHLINILLGIIPLIPVYIPQSLSFLDMFLHTYLFEDNPIVRIAYKSDLVSLIVGYQKIDNYSEVLDLRAKSSSVLLSHCKMRHRMVSFLATVG